MQADQIQITTVQHQKIKQRIQDYINDLNGEQDIELYNTTKVALEAFLNSLHSSGSVLKDLIYGVLDGEVAAESANYDLKLMWQKYKVDSKMRQHQRHAETYMQSLEPLTPAASNPIGYTGGSNQYSGGSPWSSASSSTHSRGRPPSHNSGIFTFQPDTPSPQAGPSPEQTARGRRIQASHHAAATGPLNRMAYLAANIHNYNVPPASPAVSLNSNAQFHMGIHNYQNAGGTLPTYINAPRPPTTQYPNFNSYQGYPHGYRPGPPS